MRNTEGGAGGGGRNKVMSEGGTCERGRNTCNPIILVSSSVRVKGGRNKVKYKRGRNQEIIGKNT